MKLATISEIAKAFNINVDLTRKKLKELGINPISYRYYYGKKTGLFDFEEVKAKIKTMGIANKQKQIVPVSDSFVRLDKWIANIKQSH